jgi:uncharacterized protein
MDRWFQTEGGKKVDIIDACIEQVKENNNLKIYIATDSQNRKEKTHYAIAVVFRYGLRGAHYVYKKISVPRIRDHFIRLFNEASYTIELAQLITEQTPLAIAALEFDFNNEKKTESTKVVSAATGWAASLGYSFKVKPDEMIAAKAADYCCRK